jgi:hypothetical protein
MKNTWIVSCIISWSLLVCPLAAHGTSFTLSDEALMSLDYKYSGEDTIMNSITNVAGPGVQFDFLYADPRNSNGKEPALYWTSCIYGGSGTLTGIDISSFDAFSLKFTLVSANGVQSPDAVGPLVVGALINQSGAAYAYRPEVIAINGPASATSVTTTDASQIDLVGFVCNIPYWWYDPEGPLGPSPWDPDGAIISLLVEPAQDAVIITPEPATLLFLCAGAAFLRRKF